MEVDPAPAVRDKKRFEVKKVALICSTVVLTYVYITFLTILSVERGGFVVLGWASFTLTCVHVSMKSCFLLLDIVVDNCAICRNHIMDLCEWLTVCPFV